MSGRTLIDMRTEESIFLQGAYISGGNTVFGCGCEHRGGKWWLCSYHDGFEAGLEAGEQL